jgi:hypothetical protein
MQFDNYKALLKAANSSTSSMVGYATFNDIASKLVFWKNTW